jgi:hypothetical protein
MNFTVAELFHPTLHCVGKFQRRLGSSSLVAVLSALQNLI